LFVPKRHAEVKAKKMADTATLEESYSQHDQLRVTQRGGQTIYVRYFNIPHDELETLMPAVGATHSVEATQVVVAVGTVILQGALRGFLPVTYMKRVESGSGI